LHAKSFTEGCTTATFTNSPLFRYVNINIDFIVLSRAWLGFWNEFHDQFDFASMAKIKNLVLAMIWPCMQIRIQNIEWLYVEAIREFRELKEIWVC